MKVKIICAEHGVFEQNPNNHLNQGRGCRKCSDVASGNAHRHTKEQFIAKANSLHGDRFDYSLVEYVNNSTKVKIICPIHGLFEQRPADHTRSSGCPECGAKIRAQKKRKTTKQFISESRDIHGDKYDYSQSKYVAIHANVTIICYEHGAFEQLPSNHLRGAGCDKCGHIETANSTRGTARDFISRAVQMHDNKYDYSVVDYVSMHVPVKIVCPTHGVFFQTPGSHLNGSGCAECGLVSRSEIRRTTIDQFINSAIEVHGDKYDYSLVEYISARIKVKIICPEHGVFEQTPDGHIHGKGCSKCGFVDMKIAQSLTKEQFITKSNDIHDDKFDYSEVEYVNNSTKIKIICPEHGVFLQVPGSHLAGRGCQQCGDRGFNLSKPAILYYLRVEAHNQLAYKIGITNRTVKDRFRDDPGKITVIHETQYDIGQDAYNLEREILKEYAHAQYTGEPILTSGNTELFRYDILKLDGEILG